MHGIRIILCLLLAGLPTACVSTRSASSIDWDNLNFAAIHCDAYTQDPGCDTNKNDLSVLGKGKK